MVPSRCVCGLCRARVCVPCMCAGLSVRTVSDCGRARSRRHLLPSVRDRQCTLHRTSSCSDLLERRPRGVPNWTLSTRVSYEPTLSLVTLWVKKKKTTPEMSASSGLQSLGWLHGKTSLHYLCQPACTCLIPFVGRALSKMSHPSR